MLFGYIVRLFIGKAYSDIVDHYYIRAGLFFGPIFGVFDEIN